MPYISYGKDFSLSKNNAWMVTACESRCSKKRPGTLISYFQLRERQGEASKEDEAWQTQSLEKPCPWKTNMWLNIN